MKFLCLIYMNEAERDAIPADQWEPLMEEGYAFRDELSFHRRPLRRDQGTSGRSAGVGCGCHSELAGLVDEEGTMPT